MVSITLPETEYRKLKRQAQAYRGFAARFFELIIKDPIQEVVDDFQKTNLYSKEFLEDLESGLRKSSYVEYRHQTVKKRL